MLAIQGIVESMWGKYDDDNSGQLGKDETRKFVQEILGPGNELTDEDFNEVFVKFDKDRSGTVEKQEMAMFIKGILGIQSEKNSMKTESEYQGSQDRSF